MTKAINKYIVTILQYSYRHPLIIGVLLSVLTSLYLINDYAIVNRSALPMLWSLSESNDQASDIFSYLICMIASTFDCSVVTAAHALMVMLHAILTALLLLMARVLSFSILSQWAVIVLLLAHPNYNDFRAYILPEPLFWCLWLLAIYLLLLFYRHHTVIAIVLWLSIFLIATQLNVAAWFWLLLFPFGAIVWRPWRRKSVAYALIGYAIIVAGLLFLPLNEGVSPIAWFVDNVVKNPARLLDMLSINDSNWVKEENDLMAGVFVFSGASSLVTVRTIISFGIACVLLTIYGAIHKQYRIIESNQRRILVYAVVFDVSISVVLFLLGEDSHSILAFSASFLLLFFAALGLSYIVKNIYAKRYSRLTVLVLVWCFVAYIANGFIIFGPKKSYIKSAGTAFVNDFNGQPIYSNDQFFLFYVKKSPNVTLSVEQAEQLSQFESFYYAYAKNRNHDLPTFLVDKSVVKRYRNRRGDQLILYNLDISIKAH